MATSLIGGAGIGLGLGALGASKNNAIELAAGQIMLIPPGQFMVLPGPYTFLQFKDPISGLWTNVSQSPNVCGYVSSDGANFRLANLTGCAVGAYITNAGSGYTSAPSVTSSTGSSKWTALIGKAISGTVTITTAGAGYNYTPQLLIDAPPTGGIQATAICALSAGAINSVTVINQGAGYTSVPNVTVVPDPRESTATTPGPTTAGVLTAALLSSGTVNAIVPTDHGTPITSVPTLTISGGGGASAAATVVMCFTATAFAVSNAGVAYGNAQPFGVITTGGIVGGAAGSVVNPLIGSARFTPRQASIAGTTTAGSVITATGQVVNDGGLFQAVPTGLVLPSGTAALPTTTAIVTITVGGTSDLSYLQPIQ